MATPGFTMAEDFYDLVPSPILEKNPVNRLVYDILARDWSVGAINNGELADEVSWFLYTCHKIDNKLEAVPGNKQFHTFGPATPFDKAIAFYVRQCIKKIPKKERPSALQAAASSKVVEKSVSLPLFGLKSIDTYVVPLIREPLLIQFMRNYNVDPLTVNWSNPDMKDVDYCEAIWRNIPEEQKLRYISDRWLRDGVPRLEPNDLLSNFDMTFILDDSGSMNTGGRWGELRKVALKLTDIASQSNPRGFGFRIMNQHSEEVGDASKGEFTGGYNRCNNPDFVMQVLNSIVPYGLTPIAENIEAVLGPYMKNALDRWAKGESVMPLSILIVTDGEPRGLFGVEQAKLDVENVIVKYAKQLDDAGAPERQVGIQIVQIGDDGDCEAWLEGLDDDLKLKHGLKRDMVDRKTFRWIRKNGGFIVETLVKVIVGAMNSNIDAAK